MDITGWTIEQRMRLPEWCYGNRELIGCEVQCILATTYYFTISEIVMPDPAVIWAMTFWARTTVMASFSLRVGLRATVPTNEAEMNTATEIFPYVGQPFAGPNKIRFAIDNSVPIRLGCRRGMATGGLKVVMALYSSQANVWGDVVLDVSGLPTNMAGWLSHNIV